MIPVAGMPNHQKERIRKQLQGKAISTAVWDPGQCTKDLWDWEMARIPRDAIGADMTKHAPHNSYSPKFWYRDQEFQCADCGRTHVWTAKEQRWWYEVAKGPIYTRAVRCRECQKAFKERTGKLSHAEQRAKNEAKRQAARSR